MGKNIPILDFISVMTSLFLLVHKNKVLNHNILPHFQEFQGNIRFVFFHLQNWYYPICHYSKTINYLFELRYVNVNYLGNVGFIQIRENISVTVITV